MSDTTHIDCDAENCTATGFPIRYRDGTHGRLCPACFEPDCSRHGQPMPSGVDS